MAPYRFTNWNNKFICPFQLYPKLQYFQTFGFKDYDELYRKLGMRDGEKNTINLLRQEKWKQKTWNVSSALQKKIKDCKGREDLKRDGRVILINFNGSHTRNWSRVSNPIDSKNCWFIQRIKMTKVNDALKRMKQKKSWEVMKSPLKLGPAFSDTGLGCLTNLFITSLIDNKLSSVELVI